MSVYRNKPELVWPYSVQGHNVIDSVVPDPPPVVTPPPELCVNTMVLAGVSPPFPQLQGVGAVGTNPTGSRLYVGGTNLSFEPQLVSVELATPFDVTTGGAVTNIPLPVEMDGWGYISGAVIPTADESSIYLISDFDGRIVLLDLNTPGDILGGVTFVSATPVGFYSAFNISPDEDMLYGLDGSTIEKWTVDTPGDLSTLTPTGDTFSPVGQGFFLPAFWIGEGGDTLLVDGQTNPTLVEYNLPVNGVVGSAVPSGESFNYNGVTYGTGVISINGANLFKVDDTNGEIHWYTMACP